MRAPSGKSPPARYGLFYMGAHAAPGLAPVLIHPCPENGAGSRAARLCDRGLQCSAHSAATGYAGGRASRWSRVEARTTSARWKLTVEIPALTSSQRPARIERVQRRLGSGASSGAAARAPLAAAGGSRSRRKRNTSATSAFERANWKPRCAKMSTGLRSQLQQRFAHGDLLLPTPRRSSLAAVAIPAGRRRTGSLPDAILIAR